MSMTKKDYVAIAAVISDAAVIDHQDVTVVLRRVALGIADHAAKGNSLFDRNRFLVACGVTFNRSE